MVKLEKVEPGVRICFPLKKSGWAFVEPSEHGILAKFEGDGIFISEKELKKVGYVRKKSRGKVK